MSIQIKLKNSVVQDRTPSTSDLPVVGELALNANINSIGGFMRASDNTIVKIFGPGSVTTPTATTTVSGIAELATNTETTTGTATNRVVTPAGLNAVTVAERATSNTNYVAKAGSTLTGVLTMPNGSNSAPAINFGDSDSGIFGGTNTVSLAAGGATRLTANTGVDVTGNLTVSGLITGTGNLVIADNIIHSGDTDTSVGFPAANTVNIQTGGSERARVDSSGRLLIGTSTAQTNRIDANTFDPLLQITSNIEAAASITRFSNTTNPGRFSLQKSRGTIASPVIVQDDDVLGEVLFSGWDGDTFTNGAKIIAAVDGTPGDDDMPSRLVFSTTADGAASSTTRLTIDSTGTSTFAGNIVTTGTLNGKDVVLTDTTPSIFFNDSSANPDYEIQNANGVLKIRDTTNSATRFAVNTDGHIDIAGNLDLGAGLDVTGAISTTGNLSITNVAPKIFLTDSDTDSDFSIRNMHGVFGIHDQTNSADRLTLDSNGNVRVGDSSINIAGVGAGPTFAVNGAAPEITLRDSATGNPYAWIATDDTGSLNLAADQGNNAGSSVIKFRVDGSERTRIDESGRVGIGTTSPNSSTLLHISTAQSGSAAGTGITLSGWNGSAESRVQIMSYGIGNGTLAIRNTTSNTELLRIDDSGNVGIGKTSPAANLHIQDGSGNTEIKLQGGASTANDVIAFLNSAGSTRGNITYDTDNDFVLFNVNTSERMRIDSAGNVGIGTSSPEGFGGGYKTLEVAGSTNANGGVFKTATADSAGSGSSGTEMLMFTTDTAGQIAVVSADPLLFQTANTERMRIDASGNVGIGTTSTGSYPVGVTPRKVQMEIKGAIDVGAATHQGQLALNCTNSSSALHLVRSDNDQTSGLGIGSIMFSYSDGTDFHAAASILAIKGAAGGNNDTPGALTFSTTMDGASSVTERMRIDSAGRVLIGTTTEGNGNADTLTIAGSTDSGMTIRSGSSSAGQIFFSDATSGNAEFAGFVQYLHNQNSLNFGTDETLRMMINNVGNVGIGTTSLVGNAANIYLTVGGSTLGGIALQANGTNQGYLQGTNSLIRLSSDGAKPIVFDANGSERMRITSGGNVGIGLSAIAGRVHAHSAANTATFLADGEVDNPQYPSYGFAGQNADNGSRGAGMYLPGDNTLAFATAGNERVRISGDGFVSIGNTSAEGSRLHIDSSGVSQNTLRLKQSHSSALIHFNEVTNTSYVGDGYKYHGSRSAGSNYNFMAFDSAHASTPDREFTIRGDGNAYADGTWNNNGADYAEFFESSTGSAIPVGTTVVLDNNKVRAATSSDAVGNIIGVVRPKEPGQASMTIGNTAWNKWQGKYLTDDFDRFILDEHNVINWTDADGTFHSYESHAIPSDVTVPSDAQILTEDVNGNKFTHYRLNPDYDSSKTYVPRSDRDEWVVVGLVGQVKVLKGQAVNDRWVKMKDVSDTVEEYFIR